MSAAIDPQRSATVSASAGTGKTWLLVSRLIRLLLAGARPDGILAVTFTRKAAAEMQTRLNARLLELAQCPAATLPELLAQIGAPSDTETCKQARTLYETLLASPTTVKASTFHAFCQDILQRFPLEAGIAPGFELLEGSAELQQAAWDALCAESSIRPDNDNAQALEILFEACGSLHSAQAALNSFLAHRSDWWAFTEDQPGPLAYATDTLTGQLGVSQEDDPQAEFFSPVVMEDLAEFAELLRKHSNATNQKALDALAVARDPETDNSARFQACCRAFLTQKGTPLARKESKAQAKAMGEAGQQRFLDIHSRLCEAIAAARAQLHAQQTLRRTTAWYRAGSALLQHFQRLKTEQRLLDFADLEWQAYRLLNHGDNVHWIQYKLDQRIDHLLIDEFQDTNPTQWRLILPLLQELAAGEDERGRSVFLVGDNKQSIYRFRRADPELFLTAQQWLQDNLNTVSQPLDTSWRSARAIMDFTNRIFGDGPLHQRLVQFSPHSTHHQALWGRVEFLPLVEPTPEPEEELATGLRNPLQTPRILVTDQRHLEEGRQIAVRIQQLMATNTLLGPAQEGRPIDYGDIMILVRHRTHVEDYEQALREANIPYASANRGTLLDSQEAQDMVNLLELLTAPFNNLALASLLRSPLFDCSHQDLIALAQQKEGAWYSRLTTLASQQSNATPLHRAKHLLSQWQACVGRLPVHDLLDRIYCEGDVLNRYQAAYPPHLRHRVVANLTRFLELALEVDSGRYPTIGHFVARLHSLRQQDQDAPDEGTPTQTDSRVRVMTIHASKGLEAPVVFLADSTNSGGGKQAYQAIVDWPTSAPRPNCFLLAGKKEQRDDFSQRILDHHAHAEAREDANLLYVAVTRAQQLLFISGCRPNRGQELGWYGLMEKQCRATDEASLAGTAVFESGDAPTSAATQAAVATESTAIDPRLQHPLIEHQAQQESVAPSAAQTEEQGAATDSQGDADSLTKGIVVHRMLELLCEGEQAARIGKRVATELSLDADSEELVAWLEMATDLVNKAELQWIFAPQGKAYNEAPIQYRLNNKTVFGIIDRLLVDGDNVWIIDYKTHAVDSEQAMSRLIAEYRNQLALYCQGAARLWPGKTVRGGLLFTHSRQFIEIT